MESVYFAVFKEADDSRLKSGKIQQNHTTKSCDKLCKTFPSVTVHCTVTLLNAILNEWGSFPN